MEPETRVRLVVQPRDMRNPVPVGTHGTVKDVRLRLGRWIWVQFDGTGEAQTMLPDEVQPL